MVCIHFILHAAGGEVIVVAACYRLNAFGYLALPSLAAKDERGVSGNYGVLVRFQLLRALIFVCFCSLHFVNRYAAGSAGCPSLDP